ncbi:MAG: PepSY domain-containing protein [Bacteroidales bacterium]|nr:PepSY domain-containing protein [Bacteroidales bacterium]
MRTGITFKKLHRWPGLIISFILLYYGITGIFMNHRETFSGLDVSYRFLPDNYKYSNWNNASLKGSLILSPDSILMYGNMGIWLTDSSFSRYHSFNDGLPEGSDNRKVADVHLTASGDLYAATFFGLWAYDWVQESWQKFSFDDDTRRFTAIESRGGTVYALSRSYLYYGASDGISTRFTRHQIEAPDDFTDRVTLFETIWQIHSGEIFGLPGKLFVDLLGLITVFLSITGIIYFFFPGWIKKRARKDKPAHRIIRVNKWSLKWHNKVGAWTFFLLIILFFTGMFLRPPLLIAIANAKVAPLKYSNLDQPNPWYDKLRDLLWDDRKGLFLQSDSVVSLR